jgi:hypothetical protein|tara:strand:+ start:1255 stop:2265 length:1011 start_codon:yes stop_codon:yes gene_type:complete
VRTEEEARMATTLSTHATATAMTKAASGFVGSLSTDQRARTVYQFEDGERVFWYYPPMNRHGIPLRDLDAAQREKAFALLESGLTPRSYQQARDIIELETVLGPLEKEQGVVSFVRDPELYYFTVFGDPDGDGIWGWRAEGHHISIHFSVQGDRVLSMTPFFFGTNPAEVRSGPKKGMRVLTRREDLAFELMNSLDEGQTSRAVIYREAPKDILTYNASAVSLPAEEGLPASAMNATQQGILRSLVQVYVDQVAPDLAQERLAKVDKEGFDKLYWAWGGPTQMGEPHYYRIHGVDYLAEFDNRQNGANHIHSVWRDASNDFANDVLREHLILYHVI